ncbi:P-loop NTPase [Legionella impletisoli]|uniref:Site-determining protein n=1 Tax=Legionella impletisoli TaxID=343510 RepID=A0A917JNW1_9GAMM|nr:P-loop NTPase [Legionella impletisoli]GGI79488.1 site-determining protein [Legionella impletisoli]
MSDIDTEISSHFLSPQGILNQCPQKIIALSSGKGGVGKSVIALNLAIALDELDKKVLLFDGDLRLPSIDMLLGKSGPFNLNHVLKGVCSLEESILKGPGGLDIISAAYQEHLITSLSTREQSALVYSIHKLFNRWNYLIIDTPAGLSEETLGLARYAEDMILVVCNEPTSVAATYTLIKLMNERYDLNDFHILANMVQDEEEGERVFNKLVSISDQFLEIRLNFLGSIPFQSSVRCAIKMQQPFLSRYPKSKSAKAISSIAAKINSRFLEDANHGEWLREQMRSI